MKGIEAAFVGRLGGDPQERVSAKGAVWASFTVAVDGNEEQTTWVRCACFGDLAQRVAAELHKGSRCLVEGALRQSSWTDKQTGELRYGLEVAAWRVEVVGLIGERRPRKPKDEQADGPRRPAGPSNAASDYARPRASQGAQAGCARNEAGDEPLIPF
jgi:single-strand DNA-binding protein